MASARRKDMHSSRRERRTWSDDLVEYFQEFGGEAHYSKLYRDIEINPRKLPDLFRLL